MSEPLLPKQGKHPKPTSRVGKQCDLLPLKKNPPLSRSFAYAFSGIGIAFFRERNLRVHLGVGAGALYFGSIYGLSSVEWAVLLLTIGMVTACELLNTAVEHLTDLVAAGQLHPLLKVAKDTAAAGVLVAALASIGVGAFLFGNPQRLSLAVQAMALRPLPPLVLASATLLLIFLPLRQNGKPKASHKK
jgi:diacylglycerol kinase